MPYSGLFTWGAIFVDAFNLPWTGYFHGCIVCNIMGVSVQVLNIPISNLEASACVDGLIHMCEMNLLWMDN